MQSYGSLPRARAGLHHHLDCAKLQQRHLEALEKGEVKSHRDKVKDLNTYLSNMTDHYDLPRVSKGN